MKRFWLGIVTILLAMSIVGLTQESATARGYCDGQCNYVKNISQSTCFGVYNNWSDLAYSWTLCPGQTSNNSSAMHQVDVDGVYIGSGYEARFWWFDYWGGPIRYTGHVTGPTKINLMNYRYTEVAAWHS